MSWMPSTLQMLARETIHGFDVVKVFKSVAPTYEDEVCDLTKDKTISKQFVPE